MEKLPVLKVVIAGDENVGKTSLVRRYCEGKFDESRVATIGVDFQTQTCDLPEGKVKLSIWDMAGQERFRFFRQDFYRGALATALVYDVTETESLANLSEWVKDVVEVVPKQKFLVVGNKIDLEQVVNSEAAEQFASSIEASHIQTSAKTGAGVDELFEILASLAVKK
ncbi:MAG: GTP-binding protein [Anaerolineales bacterium]|nr:GTP-binding protein [Anaerolineales bacterium]